jgi:hypothetical protein
MIDILPARRRNWSLMHAHLSLQIARQIERSSVMSPVAGSISHAVIKNVVFERRWLIRMMSCFLRKGVSRIRESRHLRQKYR